MDYWDIQDSLYITDGVILRDDAMPVRPLLHAQMVSRINESSLQCRVIIPPVLRPEIIESLHAAHQGVSAMNERAQASVYWPGITKDIQRARESCRSCNQNAPSQTRPPPVAPWIPSTPFEAISCDYFDYKGMHYFVAADRLSGWTEQERIHVGTNESGSCGLCNALRRLFARFGVPVEISCDGGPEFVAKESTDFYTRLGVRHRLSSAYFPQSNGRAEVAVKLTKRLLEDNMGVNGNLNTDTVV